MSDYHDEMMVVQGQITAALESAGIDPCPSIKLAQEATSRAWDIWNQQAERIAELEEAVRSLRSKSRRKKGGGGR